MKQSEVEQKYPVAIFELIPVNKVGSGFIREDTLNVSEENKIRIIHPKKRVIMNKSIVRQESTKTPGTFVNVPTRFIYNQEEIFVDKQDEQKLQPSLRDKLVFINGFITMPKDGAWVGGYDFMMSHAQNETNPNRITSLQPVFREIKPAKVAADSNVHDFQVTQAMGIILKLVKEKGDQYEYNEEGIDVLAAQFGVSADSAEQKVKSLVAFAKTKPILFLEEAKKGVQTVSIEIKHAIQLKLIKIDGTAIVYSGGAMIKNFSNAQNTDEKKLSGLGAYFQKVEGKEAYELFKAKLAAAKEEAVA